MGIEGEIDLSLNPPLISNCPLMLQLFLSFLFLELLVQQSHSAQIIPTLANGKKAYLLMNETNIVISVPQGSYARVQWYKSTSGHLLGSAGSLVTVEQLQQFRLGMMNEITSRQQGLLLHPFLCIHNQPYADMLLKLPTRSPRINWHPFHRSLRPPPLISPRKLLKTISL